MASSSGDVAAPSLGEAGAQHLDDVCSLPCLLGTNATSVKETGTGPRRTSDRLTRRSTELPNNRAIRITPRRSRVRGQLPEQLTKLAVDRAIGVGRVVGSPAVGALGQNANCRQATEFAVDGSVSGIDRPDKFGVA